MKKKIPALGSAVLALAAGCGDEPPINQLEQALNTFCMLEAQCGTSEGQCDGTYSEVLAAGASDACVLAYAAYYNCLSTLSCDQIREEDDDDLCVAEGDALDVACPENSTGGGTI